MYVEKPIERYASRMVNLFKRYWEGDDPRSEQYRADLKHEIELAARRAYIRWKKQTTVMTPGEEVRWTLWTAINNAVAKDPEDRRIVKVSDMKLWQVKCTPEFETKITTQSFFKPQTEEPQTPKSDDSQDQKTTAQAAPDDDKTNAANPPPSIIDMLYHVIFRLKDTPPKKPNPEKLDDAKPVPDIPAKAAPAHSRNRRHDRQLDLPFYPASELPVAQCPTPPVRSAVRTEATGPAPAAPATGQHPATTNAPDPRQRHPPPPPSPKSKIYVSEVAFCRRSQFAVKIPVAGMGPLLKTETHRGRDT